MPPPEYTDRSDWLAPAGRLDAIDEIADAFEYRAPAEPVPRPAESQLR